jgi:hypothetical protein
VSALASPRTVTFEPLQRTISALPGGPPQAASRPAKTSAGSGQDDL